MRRYCHRNADNSHSDDRNCSAVKKSLADRELPPRQLRWLPCVTDRTQVDRCNAEENPAGKNSDRADSRCQPSRRPLSWYVQQASTDPEEGERRRDDKHASHGDAEEVEAPPDGSPSGGAAANRRGWAYGRHPRETARPGRRTTTWTLCRDGARPRESRSHRTPLARCCFSWHPRLHAVNSLRCVALVTEPLSGGPGHRECCLLDLSHQRGKSNHSRASGQRRSRSRRMQRSAEDASEQAWIGLIH